MEERLLLHSPAVRRRIGAISLSFESPVSGTPPLSYDDHHVASMPHDETISSRDPCTRRFAFAASRGRRRVVLALPRNSIGRRASVPRLVFVICRDGFRAIEKTTFLRVRNARRKNLQRDSKG